MHHRNDTSGLQALTRKGYVVDTMEVAANWALLDDVVEQVETAMMGVKNARTATCHLSHSYIEGACVYFTFAANPPEDEFEDTYRGLWSAGQSAAIAAGGNATVTFASPFPSALFGVLVTPLAPGTGWASNQAAASFRLNNGGGATAGFFWLALGT